MFTVYCWVLNCIIIVINCWCPRNTSHWKKKIGTLPGDIPPRVTPATSEQIVIDLLNVECPLHKCPPAAWNFYHTMQAKHTDLGPLTFSMSLGPNSNKSANKAPRLGLDFSHSLPTWYLRSFHTSTHPMKAYWKSHHSIDARFPKKVPVILKRSKGRPLDFSAAQFWTASNTVMTSEKLIWCLGVGHGDGLKVGKGR